MALGQRRPELGHGPPDALGDACKDGKLHGALEVELNGKPLGEADAGIVYTTDAATVSDGSIATLDIPDELNTIATYPIATLTDSPNAELAQKFVDYVLGAEGQRVLVKYGFIPTIGSATGAAPAAVPLGIGGVVDRPFSLTQEAFNAAAG